LADAVATALAAHGEVERVGETGPATLGGSYALLVVAGDEWDASTYTRFRHACAAAGLPWLPVRAELGTVAFGRFEFLTGSPGVRSLPDIQTRTRGAFGTTGELCWPTPCI
jgi:hypothetical protein